MKTQSIRIGNIPALVFGEQSDEVYLYVHGKLSCKENAQSFAQIADRKGYQVLSFDLPDHGERKGGEPCDVWNGVLDLHEIMSYAKANWSGVSMFAESLGAYFSLLAYAQEPLKSCLFLSPILNMERLIANMMKWFGVGEEELREKGKIPTPMGETLDWEYYSYVKLHPITRWSVPTAILYGSNDNLTEREIVDRFAQRFRCELTVLQEGEHYFHTKEQLDFLNAWADDCVHDACAAERKTKRQ